MDKLARSGLAVALLLAMLVGGGAALAQEQGRKPKQALDERADSRIRTDDVGKGTHYARKATQPGAYFNDRTREAVRKYYASHPASGSAHQKPWQIGQRLPAATPVEAVPAPIAGSLPKLPPGHQYVQVAGDILLIAAGSRMVVDGIEASLR